ncbi:hypothetical protein C7I36_15350 [Zobellella taiwanensis]|jgi:hypothetical protein|uniref:Uncharacterized protein n=1 Tax=Zobellella taiwanensis TaxID=347535 RepID=A0A2P7QHN8_9GAMM|nr:hypothetical protein [Zobellella taiwanensis]PSJ37492.1 hypothetical protein C7I36_15350 [Zobellella taiwanensis]
MNQHEGLRKALHWLLQQPAIDAGHIAEACRRFDLAPLDEIFLRDYFRPASPGGTEGNPQSDDLESN